MDTLSVSNETSDGMLNVRNSMLHRRRRRRLISLTIFIYGVLGSLGTLYFVLGDSQLKGIFNLQEDVVSALNLSFNIFVYVIPAFVAAFMGSITRLLLASNDNILDHLRILIGSGLIGVLTFLGLKSGIVLDLLASHVEVTESLTTADKQKLFYKYIVVCFITGMFSTTMFLTIEARVTSLANKLKNN